jgi:hypothetical protein
VPAVGKPGVEQLARRRLVVPDGDRRHRAQSGDVVGKIKGSIEWDENIVGVLVLRHDLADSADRMVSATPLQHALEGRVLVHLSREALELGIGAPAALRQ